MPWYCSTGGQPGLEGWTRETSSHVLQVGHRRGQHRLNRQAAHPLSQPCPKGAEIMGGVQGKWPAWPGDGASLGIWALPAERHSPPSDIPLALWSGGDCLSLSHFPLTSQKLGSGSLVQGHTTTAGPHPT